MPEPKICSKHNKPILMRHNSTISSGGCALCIIEKKTSKATTPRERVEKTGLKCKRKPKRKTEKYKKADAIFSLYVRQINADEQGIVYCISCGKPQHWTSVDNGHFIGREHKGLRFNLINCNPQCRHENRFKEGNKVGYRLGLVKKYGENTVSELEAKQHETYHMSQFEIDHTFNHYYSECKRLGFAVEVKNGKLIY